MIRPAGVRMPSIRRPLRDVKKRPITGPRLRLYGYSRMCGAESDLGFGLGHYEPLSLFRNFGFRWTSWLSADIIQQTFVCQPFVYMPRPRLRP